MKHFLARRERALLAQAHCRGGYLRDPTDVRALVAVLKTLVRWGCEIRDADWIGIPKRRRVLQVEIEPPPDSAAQLMDAAAALLVTRTDITYATRMLGIQILWTEPRIPWEIKGPTMTLVDFPVYIRKGPWGNRLGQAQQLHGDQVAVQLAGETRPHWLPATDVDVVMDPRQAELPA